MTRDEAELRLSAFVPMLVDRFPDAAFTKDSLEHCASLAVKGFPTYGELAAWLAAWWRDHRPIIALPPPPPVPPRPPPTEEEVAYVHDRVAEVIAALRSARVQTDAQAQRLDEAVAHKPRALYLDAATLDRLNPLPNGRKRTDATPGLRPSEAAAPVDPHPPAATADAAAAS